MSIDAKNATAIVLAAGLSQRMGSTNKLLLEIDGQSLLRRSVLAATEAGIGEVIVVLGHESERTRLQIDALPVRHVINAEYQTGQMSSVQCGLNAAHEGSEAILICLADQPLIKACHLQRVLQGFAELPQNKSIVVPVYKEQRGNPVVISGSVHRQLLATGGNPGCRKYIDKHPERVYWLDVDDAAFTTDIDTPADYTVFADQHSQDVRTQDNENDTQ